MGCLKRECSFEHAERESASIRELSRGFMVKSLHVMHVEESQRRLNLAWEHYPKSFCQSCTSVSEISTLKAMPFDLNTIFRGSQLNMNELPLEKT